MSANEPSAAPPGDGPAERRLRREEAGRSTRRWFLRVAYLMLLAAVTVLLLTAAQISYAYLSATGGGGAVSAVAIRDTARFYEDNRRAHLDVLDAIKRQQERRVDALSLSSDATLYEYFNKVQYRRFLFGCFPQAYATAKDAFKTQKGDAEVDEMNWWFLLATYQEARKPVTQPDGAAPAAKCATAVRQNRTAVEQLRSSQFDNQSLFADCSTDQSDMQRLECLWDNVTYSVGLQEIAVKHRGSLDAELDARRGSAASLDSELTGDKAIADPSGRAAVAAWLSLHGPMSAPLPPDQARAAPASTPSPGAAVAQLPATAKAPPAAGAGPRPGLLGQLADLPARLIAFLVTMPILAQSAAMAMAAGALGGGVARVWELLGYRRSEPRVITEAAEEVKTTTEHLRELSPADPELESELDAVKVRLGELGDAIREASASLMSLRDQQTAKETAPVAVASFCGAVSALILWLLTTSGLFVLTGGDNATSASPNVLLALALIAGLVYAQVVDRIFTIAERTLQRGS